jgi:hypothetical protein
MRIELLLAPNDGSLCDREPDLRAIRGGIDRSIGATYPEALRGRLAASKIFLWDT